VHRSFSRDQQSQIRTATRSCQTRKREVHFYSPGVAAAASAAAAAAAAAAAVRQFTD